jgi:hypothetical protein
MHSLEQAILACECHVIDGLNFGRDAKSVKTRLKKSEKNNTVSSTRENVPGCRIVHIYRVYTVETRK